MTVEEILYTARCYTRNNQISHQKVPLMRAGAKLGSRTKQDRVARINKVTEETRDRDAKTLALQLLFLAAAAIVLGEGDSLFRTAPPIGRQYPDACIVH
jgi:hypothetical protein